MPDTRRKRIPAEALINLRRRLDGMPARGADRQALVTSTAELYGVSRATVYRAIGRLRIAFTTAGLTNVSDCRRREVC